MNVNKDPSEKKVVAHYNPDKPENAVPESRVGLGAILWLFVVIGIVLLLIIVVGLWFALIVLPGGTSSVE